MTDNITYSFVACDVAVTMDEDVIKRELMETYHGVKQVTRLVFDDEDHSPKTRVQIDFKSYKDAKKIYRDRSIILGGISRRVFTVRTPPYQEHQGSYHEYQEPYQNGQDTWQYTSEQTWEPEPELVTEESLIDMFEQQKTYVFRFNL
jgi:hypothetical protein